MEASKDRTQGFTLMELAIAITIFLIGLIALLQLMIVTLNINQVSRDMTLATALAQAKTDDLLRLGFNAAELTPGGAIPTTSGINPLQSPNPSPLQCYTDFFNYQGQPIAGPPTPCTGTAGAGVPANTYFVRQWQILYCNSSCGTANDRCTAACLSGNLKKVTVTVTAFSSAFRGKYQSATMVVYLTQPN